MAHERPYLPNRCLDTLPSGCAQVLQELHGPVRERLDAELQFFDTVTAVSGKLYPVPKVGGWVGCWRQLGGRCSHFLSSLTSEQQLFLTGCTCAPTCMSKTCHTAPS